MHAFEFLTKNAEYGQVFFQGMGSMSASETEPILAAYDFSQFGTVVDFCGGQGALLAGILGAAPGCEGVLFDPRVEENGAAEFLAAQGVADRTKRVVATCSTCRRAAPTPTSSSTSCTTGPRSRPCGSCATCGRRSSRAASC
ncbi:methyltransferase [Streptomyces rochei]|nr:methyltransferase [Streptomyces rochei]WMI61491.1 methyltransferase [Streptomyces rochei]